MADENPKLATLDHRVSRGTRYCILSRFAALEVSTSSWFVKLYRHVPRVVIKIWVSGEDWEVESVGDGTDEEVHAASCHAVGTAQVVEACGLLVVGCEDEYVVEVYQPLAKPPEIPLLADSG
jgi:hypothetical protein